jgi:hypothetical protein
MSLVALHATSCFCGQVQALHWVQADCPVALEKLVPGGQGKQDVLPLALAYVPMGHSVQLLGTLDAFEKVPGRQGVQSPLPLVEKVPGPHCVQTEDALAPEMEEDEPAGQALHAPLPGK